MLRSSSKTKMFGALVSLASLPLFCAVSASAADVTRNTNFQVNVADALSVRITTPDDWATGDTGQFLRNHINVYASTNCAAGLTATMTTKTTNTSLVNTRKNTFTIPTLANGTTVSAFPANRWGYSLEDTIAAIDPDAPYDPLVAPGDQSGPIEIYSLGEAGSFNQDVFFGAKADNTIASGTYANTVVFNFVTGVIQNDPNEPDYNPVTPTNPSTDTTPNTPTYNPTTNRTTYTTVTHDDQNDTTSTTTEVTSGDTRSQYANPQGVKHKSTTTTEVNDGNALATGLAVASAVAGATGFIFFIVGKRRKDEDEEENGGEQQPPIQY